MSGSDVGHSSSQTHHSSIGRHSKTSNASYVDLTSPRNKDHTVCTIIFLVITVIAVIGTFVMVPLNILPGDTALVISDGLIFLFVIGFMIFNSCKESVPCISTAIRPRDFPRKRGFQAPFHPFQLFYIFLWMVLWLFSLEHLRIMKLGSVEFCWIDGLLYGFAICVIFQVITFGVLEYKDPRDKHLNNDLYEKNVGVKCQHQDISNAIKLGKCRLCDFYVDSSSVHCNICNRCAVGFYHHSKIFNICIGTKNVNKYCFHVFISLTLLCAIIAQIIALSKNINKNIVIPKMFDITKKQKLNIGLGWSMIALVSIVAIILLFIYLSIFIETICFQSSPITEDSGIAMKILFFHSVPKVTKKHHPVEKTIKFSTDVKMMYYLQVEDNEESSVISEDLAPEKEGHEIMYVI